MSTKHDRGIALGYRYYMGMHLAICHYPIDGIQEIRAGGLTIHDTPLLASGSITIDKPELFGGKRQGGGVVGDVDIAFGEPAQTENAYLQAQLGATIPAFRGVVCAILKQVYLAAMSPTIKPWSFLVQWLDGKACGPNSLDMNPAHIIELALTEPWGLNQGAGDLDSASFTAAEITLTGEALGLSFVWLSSHPVQTLIADILQHIMGVLYADLETGQFVLRLLRQGDPSELTLTEETVVDVLSIQRPLLSELTNQVVVHYRDRDEVEQVITLNNEGLIAQMGGVINSHDLRYDLAVESATVQKLAARDLRNLSTPLATVELLANREARVLRLGSLFTLTWPRHGLDEERMRVTWIDYGTLQDGQIHIQAIQDVYGVDTALYADVPPTKWEDPQHDPAPSPNRHLFEAPYFWLVQRYGEYTSVWDEIDDDAGWIMLAASKPSADASMYEMWTRGSGYAEVAIGLFSPIGTLNATLVPEVTTSTTYTDVYDTDIVDLGTYCIIETEWCEVVAIDALAGTITLKRGILDTVPQDHPVDALIYFAENFTGEDETEYVTAEIAYAKALPTTAKGTLDIALAPEDSITLAQRMFRAYPPGAFQHNAAYWPAFITGALTITWAHRDRLQQTAGYIAQDAGDIGPEAGTTYTLRVYNENGILQKEVTGLASTSYAYAIGDEITDSGLGRPNETMRIVLFSVRDSLESWQHHDYTIPECRGWGMFWGGYWGE